MGDANRSFQVLADCAGHTAGAAVTEEQLEGCNVDALIASGHLAEVHEGGGRGTPPPPSDPPAEGAA